MKRDFDLMTEQRREAVDTIAAATAAQIRQDILAPVSTEGLTCLTEIRNAQSRRYDCEKVREYLLADMNDDDKMATLTRLIEADQADDLLTFCKLRLDDAVAQYSRVAAVVAVEKAEYESQYE